MMLLFKDETPDGQCEGKGNGINKLGVQLTSNLQWLVRRTGQNFQDLAVLNQNESRQHPVGIVAPFNRYRFYVSEHS